VPILRPRVLGRDRREEPIPIAAPPDRDGVISAITKWVPIEVIAFYQGITTPFGDKLSQGLVYAISAGVIVTFLWIAFATESAKAKSRIAWRQVILSCFAFIVWVIGTTSPDIWKVIFVSWHPGINPAFLAAGAILLPILDGILWRLGIPQD
jgi:hypothetical protein